MDLLLDINVAVDICTKRAPFFGEADLCVAQCLHDGGRVWLYAGSVQTLEYVTRSELLRNATPDEASRTARQLQQQTRDLLAEFTKGKHWLAALAGEGDVFDSPDPEDEQLMRALGRFAPGTIKLLTRDALLCTRYPSLTLTPEEYLQAPPRSQPIHFVDLATQQDSIRPQLELNIHRVLHHGQYIMGGEVEALEQKLATFTGSKHCITCASGTEALLMSLMALGIGAGDEVITTPFTFAATAEMIVLAGATPVFVDIEPDTCLMNAALIEAKITPRTKAIMPVSLYGQVCDMDAINAIAAAHGNISVIEDAAQSFGATYTGTDGILRNSCNVSTVGCTSFFPSKPLGCYGDGGAIFTNDDALAKAMREIRVHGQERRYVHARVGVGGRMDTMQCAVVLSKFERFEWELQQRMMIGARYNEHLNGHAHIVAQRIGRTNPFAQFTILVENRDSVRNALQVAGIPTAVHYPIPLNQQPAYRHHCCEECLPISNDLATRVLSLPMSADLSVAQQNAVIAALCASLV
jgi:UDP-2-acetamido-2-deoxy-ribo-hexuluronate aminotransferase